MYHVVDEPRSAGESRLCCSPAMFACQMAHLAAAGWTVLPLQVVIEALSSSRPLPDRSVVITFDDGTACTLDNAMPVLVRHGFPATVFMVSGLVGGRNEWMCREGHPARALLDARQLRELSGHGVEVGSHSVDHRRLNGLSAAMLEREVGDSRRQLEDLLGCHVRHFAYPYGGVDATVRAAVQRAGYNGACSTRMGRNRSGADIFMLHRTEVMGADALWQFKLKLHTGSHDMPPWSLGRAVVKRLLARAGLRVRATPV